MKKSGISFCKIFLVVLNLCWFSAAIARADYENFTFTTFAGPEEVPSWHDGAGSQVRFSNPHKLAVDHNGNVFVADYNNHTIRKVTPGGVVTTVAGLAGNSGSADGIGSIARFNSPAAIAIDAAGNLFVADYGNHTIRKITPEGVVTTFAGTPGVPGSKDGNGASASFIYPIGLTFDNSGNLFVADAYNHTIRKITSAAKVTTFAGKAGNYGSADGTGASARFTYPFGITADTAGTLYVTDLGNNTIRKISSSGVVTTLAGTAGQSGTNDATGSAARFNQPFDVTFSGGNLFVADTYNHTIRRVTMAGEVTTLAGAPTVFGSDNGVGNAARFNYPTGLGADSNGTLFVADYGNSEIRKIVGNDVSTFVGTAGGLGSKDGPANVARFNYPAGVAIDHNGTVYVGDLANHTIRKISSNGDVSTLAGLAGESGKTNGTGSEARFSNPLGVAVDNSGNVFVADYGNSAIRKITPGGVVTTFAGSLGESGSTNGVGTEARFSNPFFLTFGPDGNLYVADTWNHLIRKITPEGEVTTLAGAAKSAGSADGDGDTARFNFPEGIAADSNGNLFVADNGNHTIRKITPAGEVTTFAGSANNSGSADGTGTAARFSSPFGLAIDAENNVYVAENGNNLIRKITPAGVVTTLGGVANKTGSENGTGKEARFSGLEGIAVDSSGILYIADSSNHDIRKGAPALPDVAVVDSPIAEVGTTRHLSVSNLTTTSWSWKLIRKPANSSAELSATNISNPTFTPDVMDRFIVRFEGKDNAGRIAINDVTIDARPPDILTLTTSGAGSVSPNYSNSKLIIGKSYTVTAKPVKGYIFAGWTGDIESSSAKLTFTMRDNLVLQANFIPDPFPAVVGVYDGLFSVESNVVFQSSGFFTGKVSAKGALSAKIQLAGKSYSLSGPLSPTGELEKTIVRKGLSSLTVKIQVNLNGGDMLTGQISDGTWTAELAAARNVFSKTNPLRVTGKYTLVIPGSADSSEFPGGNGFGTVTTDANGNIKFAGTLGDGTKISQKTIRTKFAQWPFYASLYSGNGSILSWLTFTGNSITNSGNPVTWTKLPQPKSKVYPAGFTNEVNVLGSTYNPTNGVPLLNFANGEIDFAGGNLTADFNNDFSIGSGDKVTNLSANKLTLKLTRATGLFSGSVVNPATNKSISFNGALLQNQNTGYGFFINGDQTGGVFLHAKTND